MLLNSGLSKIDVMDCRYVLWMGQVAFGEFLEVVVDQGTMDCGLNLGDLDYSL